MSTLPRIFTRMLIVFACLLLSACGDNMGFFLQEISMRLAPKGAPDPDCLREAKFSPPSAIHVDGVLIKNFIDHDRTAGKGQVKTWIALSFLLHRVRSDQDWSEYQRTYGIIDVATALWSTGLTYIEIRDPSGFAIPAWKERFQIAYTDLGGVPGSLFTRLMISKIGDPACSEYMRQLDLRRQYQPNFSPPMPPPFCVAAHAIDAPVSAYALEVEEQPYEKEWHNQYNEPPALWKIVDLRSNTTYAQLLRRDNGGGFSCPKIAVREKFWNLIQPANDKANSLDSSTRIQQ